MRARCGLRLLQRGWASHAAKIAPIASRALSPVHGRLTICGGTTESMAPERIPRG
ncbi:hypothetical protein QFZ66_008188 [Streptomyces sp. B4I13]|uniref:hypothetical protein n=1 Tax=Streptomyces sp. B4I13 TaxID=3042271 RepID=UPI002783AB55|nr:hypothetical protein [Streptomyces sp. B4I13]MDQ0964310.1 hypothetical protein [Streptomyces sp. B4I13]